MKNELVEALSKSSSVAKTLSVLAAAMGYDLAPLCSRLIAQARPDEPNEGLALLQAYVKIADIETRQAILDVVTATAFAQASSNSTVVSLIARRGDQT